MLVRIGLGAGRLLSHFRSETGHVPFNGSATLSQSDQKHYLFHLETPGTSFSALFLAPSELILKGGRSTVLTTNSVI